MIKHDIIQRCKVDSSEDENWAENSTAQIASPRTKFGLKVTLKIEANNLSLSLILFNIKTNLFWRTPLQKWFLTPTLVYQTFSQKFGVRFSCLVCRVNVKIYPCSKPNRQFSWRILFSFAQFYVFFSAETFEWYSNLLASQTETYQTAEKIVIIGSIHSDSFHLSTGKRSVQTTAESRRHFDVYI